MATPPSTGYLSAQFSVAADVDDFTFKMHIPSAETDYWGAVDTSDGTKGRVFDDDGSTERPSDPFFFDDTNEDEWRAFLRSGTTSAVGSPYTQRFYPPVSGNSSYAEGATFGQHNAYDSDWAAYYPFSDLHDRTANARDLSVWSGSLATTTGQVGDAADTGQGDYEWSGTALALSVVTLMGWIRMDSDSQPPFEIRGPNSETIGFRPNSGRQDIFFRATGGADFAQPTLTVSTGEWTHVVARADGSNAESFVDGVSEDTDAFSSSFDDVDVMHVGADNFANDFDGLVDDWQFHTVDRSDAWIAEEYDQSNDNASYFSNRTWNAASGGIVDGSLTWSVTTTSTAQADAIVDGALTWAATTQTAAVAEALVDGALSWVATTTTTVAADAIVDGALAWSTTTVASAESTVVIDGSLTWQTTTTAAAVAEAIVDGALSWLATTLSQATADALVDGSIAWQVTTTTTATGEAIVDGVLTWTVTTTTTVTVAVQFQLVCASTDITTDVAGSASITTDVQGSARIDTDVLASARIEECD